MIDSITNLLFRCSHNRLTRPVTPVSRAGVPQGDTYVVCLDCGKQFAYDLKEMRITRPVAHSASAGVVAPEAARRRKSPLRWMAWGTLVPLAWIAGTAIQRSRKEREENRRGAAPAGKP
jgi:hypothetical protein